MKILVQDASYEIRVINPNELIAVLEVYRQCEDFLALGPMASASFEMVEKDIEISRGEGGAFCGIYTAVGQMIGIVDYVPSGFEGDANLAHLSLLMIVPLFRKHGIGKAMVVAIEQEIRRNEQVLAILSGVQVNNPLAVKFWQRQGYRITGGPDLLPDQTTVFHLRKDLSPPIE